ncbi:MAG: YhbY family RNA-binding protein [Candidatus Hodarchaeota archaeon]
MDYQREFKKTLLSQPHCILGKNGITNEFIIHVLQLLKRNKIIKIKALRSVATKANINNLAVKISKLTNSHLLDVRGKIIILTKYDIKKFN